MSTAPAGTTGEPRRKDTSIGAALRRRDAKRGITTDPRRSHNDPGSPAPTGRTSGEKHEARYRGQADQQGEQK